MTVTTTAVAAPNARFSAIDRGSTWIDCTRDMPLLGTWHLAGGAAPVPMPESRDRTYVKARGRILAAALAAASSGQHVSYSRRPQWYTNNWRYAGLGLTYTYVKRAVDELSDLGWLDGIIAPSQRGGSGVQSTFWPSDRLLQHVADTPLVYCPDEVIALNDANGHRAGYRDTDYTYKERRALREWNEEVASRSITLAAPDLDWTGRPMWIDNCFIDPRRVCQHRVYNCDFHHGGRAYGGFWLDLTNSKDERWRRRQIQIDGEPTVELDFCACQPALLYAEQGLAPDGDPYRVAAVGRPTVKEAMLRMINAASKGEAEGSLAAWLAGLGDVIDRDDDPAVRARRRASVDAQLPEARRIIAAIADRHPRIAGKFCEPRLGVYLQWLEAQIMTVVAKRCLKVGIVPLCVHDSMRVPVQHEGQLTDFMHEAWFDRFGVQPRVKPD